MKRSDRSSPLGFYTIGIAALFLAGFLLLVVFGAQCFRNTVAVQNDNMQTRAVLSYLATCARSNDTAGSITVFNSENGQVLCVADGDTGYALRIYLRDGKLVEDYGKADAALSPEEAAVIGDTETFRLQELENGLFAADTDEGRVLLRARSAKEGGEP